MNKKTKTTKIRGDRVITLAILFLLIYGTLMITSAEMGTYTGDNAKIALAIAKQLFYCIIGIISMVAISRFDFGKFKFKFYVGLALFGFALLAYCMTFDSTMGANAWIYMFGFSIQPSEFAKIISMICLAKVLSSKYHSLEEEINRVWTMIAIVFACIFFVILVQRDTGSGAVMFVMACGMILMSNKKSVYRFKNLITICMLVGVILAVILISPLVTPKLANINSDSYIVNRFVAFADPFKYQYDIGYHLVMSLLAFANGGFFGKGYGSSIYKYMNFPNQSNDFILAIIVEELGIFGFLLVIIPYGIIVYRLIRHAFSKYADVRSRVILIGTILMLLTHFIFNVGGVTGFIPLTGVPLLLISSGGSSIVAFLLAIGLSQSEIKRIKRKREMDNARSSGQI